MLLCYTQCRTILLYLTLEPAADLQGAGVEAGFLDRQYPPGGNLITVHYYAVLLLLNWYGYGADLGELLGIIFTFFQGFFLR